MSQPISYCVYDLSIGHSFVEDLELANLMGSLGLPVSFSTSKVVSAHIMRRHATVPLPVPLLKSFMHCRTRTQSTRERKKEDKHHSKQQTLKSMML